MGLKGTESQEYGDAVAKSRESLDELRLAACLAMQDPDTQFTTQITESAQASYRDAFERLVQP